MVEAMTGNHRRPTLRDVAQRAGTAIPTVSKVLNGRSDVSAETRAAVLAAVDEIGYLRPSGKATLASVHQNPYVDVVISGIDGTWSNRAISGIERAAVEAGVDLVLSVARLPDEGWLTRLLARPSSGAVLALVNVSSTHLAALEAAGIPVVLLDPVTQPPEKVSSVGATNWDGGRIAAEHLLALGHRTVAVLAGQREHFYSQARVDGFRSAMSAAGAELGSTNVQHANWSRETARVLALRLLGSDRRPTAIFACSDTMALGVYAAAEELGVHIPNELSVIGFDDLPESEWVRPALTTVQQPISEMGAAALRMLLRVRGDRGTTAQREQLATRLVVRGSTGAPWE